jgi:hypothetical protein
MHARYHHWLPFVVLTGLALGIWVLSAVHGYAWQMLWLPAAISGAAWPSHVRRKRRRLRGHRSSCR